VSYEGSHSVEGHQTPSLPIIEQDSTICLTDDCLPESAPLVIVSPVAVQSEIQKPASVSSKDLQPAAERPAPDAEGEAIQQCTVEDMESRSINASEPQNLLNSKLVDRLSQRLSFTFGQPTVIRRTHLRSRPSIPFPESPILPTPIEQQGDGANDSSDPSTTPSSNGSPLGYSTPPTPVTSAEPFPSDRYKTSPSDLSTLSDCVSAVNATLASKSPTITPSIISAEAVSVAKLYLEPYYNSIFQNSDPRSQRLHELEQHMYAFQLAPDEEAQTRQHWLLQENEYLRRCRALKNMRSVQGENAPSIAGYEVIKVLGRGSFGVVRLVREKKSDDASVVEEEFSMPERSPSISGSRSLGMMRSTVDGTKHSRRRLMDGENKEVYAMKVIKKSDMIRNCQEGHIRAERDFLVVAEKSRWVVPLIASFQDGVNLYLVMDYMVGGDFLGLLIRKDILREEWTRFYVAEMILCIEETHNLCWIHRDIKPDNFLISASGHLKISDFGLSFDGHWSHDQAYYHDSRYNMIDKLGIKVTGDVEDQAHATEPKEFSEVSPHGLNEQSNFQTPSTDLLKWRNSKGRRRFAKSVVGTSQYMAPEVIRGEMYDGRCDWWSLGVIIYEVRDGYNQP